MSESADRVRDLVEHVLGSLELSGRVDITEDDDAIRATIAGEDDLGLLIGRHGQTIDALQHLAYRMAVVGDVRKRVTLDAAGYRERRGALLRHDADEAANDALRLGRPVRLEPMGAIERRLVHEHLRERGDVETYSEGVEPERRLVVAPLES
jgi:spoIIIJ-associated protein